MWKAKRRLPLHDDSGAQLDIFSCPMHTDVRHESGARRAVVADKGAEQEAMRHTSNCLAMFTYVRDSEKGSVCFRSKKLSLKNGVKIKSITSIGQSGTYVTTRDCPFQGCEQQQLCSNMRPGEIMASHYPATLARWQNTALGKSKEMKRTTPCLANSSTGFTEALGSQNILLSNLGLRDSTVGKLFKTNVLGALFSECLHKPSPELHEKVAAAFVF